MSKLAATSKQKCRAPGCTRPPQIKKHGLCHAHYKQYWRLGTLRPGPIQKRRASRPLAPYEGGANA